MPTSQDEPVLQDALTSIIVKLILGIAASAGLKAISGSTIAALTAIIAALVAAAMTWVQAKVTRNKVFPPAHVATTTSDALSVDPTQLVPSNR